MSARRPFQPLSPLSANIVGAKNNYTNKGGANVDGRFAMDEQEQDDNTQGSGSIVSGLTSLGDNGDDFDRLMIQNARDEQRLQDALRGSIQPFRKARTHSRVGLTLDNLERNNAEYIAVVGANAQLKFESPPSSISSRSDPAVRPPAEWGRKGRVKRNWMRTITSDEKPSAGAQGDATPKQTGRAATTADADMPLPSIEDSPLSRKSSFHGTPASTRRQEKTSSQEADWDFSGDLSMDFNEASLIASTPYVPRNTVLDDIRQREIESLREQAVTTNRLDKIRESSPEERRRSGSSSRHSPARQTNGVLPPGELEGLGASEIHSRKRTNSWKTLGRSQVVIGEAGELATNSPIVVYKKSSETLGLVDSGLHANAQTSPKRPSHRREDSQDLLRRLARVSSTPSPGRVNGTRPQTAPARQPGNSSASLGAEVSSPIVKNVQLREHISDAQSPEPAATAQNVQPNQHHQPDKESRSLIARTLVETTRLEHVDETPMPMEQSVLNIKTPKVTGAWIDTPAPRPSHRSVDPPRSRSRSPPGGNSSKPSPRKQKDLEPEESEHDQPKDQVGTRRPSLPSSALEAIVEEARATRRNQDSYGDSTIDSLEELIALDAEGNEKTMGGEEDTLLGLQLPTGPPRNEADRLRQQEVAQLHQMNQKLRAAKTSIRDASRGMRRVENQVEQFEETSTIAYRNCPCAAHGHRLSPWTLAAEGTKRLFYDPQSPKRMGLTWLTISLIAFLVWFISESVACDAYCHKLYAPTMIGFGVDWDAPRFPFVLPTLLYQGLFQPFWAPLWAISSWTVRIAYRSIVEDEVVKQSATKTARRLATTLMSTQTLGSFETDFSMSDDEVI